MIGQFLMVFLCLQISLYISRLTHTNYVVACRMMQLPFYSSFLRRDDCLMRLLARALVYKPGNFQYLANTMSARSSSFNNLSAAF